MFIYFIFLFPNFFLRNQPRRKGKNRMEMQNDNGDCVFNVLCNAMLNYQSNGSNNNEKEEEKRKLVKFAYRVKFFFFFFQLNLPNCCICFFLEVFCIFGFLYFMEKTWRERFFYMSFLFAQKQFIFFRRNHCSWLGEQTKNEDLKYLWKC